MEYLSNDKILVIDLASSEIAEEELSEDLVSEKIGGAGIARHLYEQHADGDPVVIGTGLLTGTLYPASALGVITAKSPATGKIGHCPVALKVGVEIKYAGFDYIVVKGKSEKPVYLWVHDGVADIADASDVWGKDVWETTDAWRKQVGDDLLQTLVIGPAGEAGSDLAQVCSNYWSGGDRFGFGKVLGGKNLKGFAFRGMGLLEIADAEEFVEQAFDLLDEIKENDFIGKKGIGEILTAMGEADAAEWLAPAVHRHSADYFTPYATNTFLYLDEDPNTVEETKEKEPGVLVTDIGALLGFKKLGLSVQDAGRAYKACCRYGIDPAAAAELCGKAGKTALADIEAALPELKGPAAQAGDGVFSDWCPGQPIFGAFDISGDSADWWERRQAVAYIFGIHPIFAVMCPQITEENLLELAKTGTELDLSQETLDAVISGLRG